MKKSFLIFTVLGIAVLQMLSGCSISFDPFGKSETTTAQSESADNNKDMDSVKDAEKEKDADSEKSDSQINVTIQNNNEVQVPAGPKTNVNVNTNVYTAKTKVPGKAKWQAEFARLEQEEKNFPGGDGVTQRAYFNKLYKTWDDDLNLIWGELKAGLDPDVFEALRKDELKWIDYKEKHADQLIDEQWPDKSSRNAWTNAWRTQYVGKETKERCYYLINNYME